MNNSYSNYKTITMVTISTMLILFLLVTTKPNLNKQNMQISFMSNDITTQQGIVESIKYTSGFDLSMQNSRMVIKFADGRVNIFPKTTLEIIPHKYTEIDYLKTTGNIIQIRTYDRFVKSANL